MASRSLMGPPRDNPADRLARIDAMLNHLRELEKDTGRIISSLQRERRRTKVDMALGAVQAAQEPVRSKGARTATRKLPATKRQAR